MTGCKHKGLFTGDYSSAELHTQSLEYVTDDIVETLLNWEAAKKEGEA